MPAPGDGFPSCTGGMNTKLRHHAIAVSRFESLLKLPNQEPDFLWKLFQGWAYSGLANAVRDTDRGRALAYVERGLAAGVAGGTRDELMRLKAELDASAP